MKRFTFKDLCRSLEKNPSLSENADAVKTLMGSVSAILGNAGSGNIIGFIRAISEKDKLIDLLRSMNSDMKRSLHNYFNGKTIYFRQYSKPLAQELARIYNWPENNDKRRNEVIK